MDGNDISNKELMSNVICNLNKQEYLSFTHGFEMVNEYNNLDLLVCMSSTLFPYGLGVPKMSCRKVLVSMEVHVKYLMNWKDKNHEFSKHNLFPFLCLISFNIDKFV